MPTLDNCYAIHTFTYIKVIVEQTSCTGLRCMVMESSLNCRFISYGFPTGSVYDCYINFDKPAGPGKEENLLDLRRDQRKTDKGEC